LIDTIRENIPNCYISTDIIVGFPGETDNDYQDTYDLVQQVRYDGVFAFMYSKREGTVAARMDNHIDLTVKRERVNKLLNLSKQIIRQNNKESIGQVMNVLINYYDQENLEYIATTDTGKTVIIKDINNCNNIDINKFYSVKIDHFIQNKLYGILIGDSEI
jgi:tRNA-2-methylthio-N6-dimethylallyladenosine synthase